MAEYQAVRKEGEEYCKSKYIKYTFIRPSYVLGRGHYWPVLLLPLYGIAEIIASLQKRAGSMAFVTIRQMLHTLITAVEADPLPLRIIEIRNIRKSR